MIACCIDTPLGVMRLEEESNAICRAVFSDADDGSRGDSPALLRAQEQLAAYFEGRLTAFALPLAPKGTAFEQAVWRALQKIPYGQTQSYGEIAVKIGRPGAARAVGGACGRNPLHVIVPCHRVLGANGKLTGFAAGFERKRTLLALESK